MITLIIISISPVMADSSDALADSQYPKAMNDNQNTGQSQYVGPQNNSTKWNYTTGDSNSQIMYAPSIGPDGTLYLATRFNNGTNDLANLYALNPDATKKWNYTIFDGILYEYYYSDFIGSPAIAQDGTIYINGHFKDYSMKYGFLYALNPDGTVKWKYFLNDNEGFTVFPTGFPAVGADGTIYLSSQYYESGWIAKLNAINPDGTKKWEYAVSEGQYGSDVPSPAIAPDGTIYFVYNYHYSSSSDAHLCALDQNGGLIWNYLINGYVKSHPAVASDGTIYLAARDGKLYAINPNGTQKWEYATEIGVGTDFLTAPSVAKDGTIYVGGLFKDDDQYPGILYAINPDGTFKWSFTTPHAVGIEAVIGDDGTIYFGDGAAVGTFYALNPDGTVKWSLEVEPTTSAAIASNGDLYFGLVMGQTYYLYSVQGPRFNPNPDPNPNPNNTASAATTTRFSGNTIGMQNTGIPMVGIIMALFMVAGGFISIQKRQ